MYLVAKINAKKQAERDAKPEYVSGMGEEEYAWGPDKEEIAYWRKHPDLHGLIIQNYANGEDNCQSVPLKKEDLRHILNLVMLNELPKTRGFFFGESYSADQQETVKQLQTAMKYLDDNPDSEIMYEASW